MEVGRSLPLFLVFLCRFRKGELAYNPADDEKEAMVQFELL